MTSVDKITEFARMPEAFEHIRMPEPRSPYSNALRDAMSSYLSEIFEQDNLLTQGMKKMQGLIIYEGSILRGTATEKTHDFDMFALVDDESVDKDETDKLSVAVRDMDDFHPRKMTFSDYLVEKLLSSPDTKSLYEARIAELQRIQDYTDERHGHEHRKAKTDSHFVIHSDTAFDTSSMLGRAIETGDLASLRDNDTPSRLILSVLSATPDLVHESVPGSLLHHQRKIVESLTKLEKTDPEKFDILWKTLEGDFANLHRSTAWRDPLRDYKLLGEYYLRTGRFVSKELSKERLVELSARQLTESVIKEEAIHYSQFDDYKNQAKLLELLVKKHGVKTGLTVADMEEIVNGGTAMENELSSLQPAQQQELASFERRLQLLKVIRQQEKMPSLKELQEAYLN